MSGRPPAAEVQVLFHDAMFLVVDKPAWLPTTGPGAGETLVQRVEALDPHAPRLHPSSRLDAEVTGVVVFARTTEAIRHLLAARRAGAYLRGYAALAAAAPSPSAGDWRTPIALDPRDPRKRAPAAAGQPRALPAHTRYRTLQALARGALLWLEPQTGRTHQLRVHAAAAGCPLLGDRPYGGPGRVVLDDGSVVSPRRTLLHCARVSVPDPNGGAALRFAAAVPADMQQIWSALGGAEIELP